MDLTKFAAESGIIIAYFTIGVMIASTVYRCIRVHTGIEKVESDIERLETTMQTLSTQMSEVVATVGYLKGRVFNRLRIKVKQ